MRVHSLELIGDAMLPKPEPACLVMADISGYTGYLAGVELDHAQDILADLIDTIVGALRPPFQLSKLEGDAAFVYLVAPEFDGSHLQDTIESAYFTFRRRQRDIKQASICECDACRLIPTLDLKFIAHYGQIAKQTMSGQEELIGRDVILVHRLLKNNVEAKLARHAYILYTDAFAQRTGMNPQAQGLIEHHETVEIIGDVRCWLRDLEAGWQADAARKRVEVTAAEAIASFVIDVEAARQTTWEFLTAPGYRVMWTAGSTGVEEDVANGRRGTGTVNHCMHGKDVIIEEILDWQPPDYLTRRISVVRHRREPHAHPRAERRPQRRHPHRSPRCPAAAGADGTFRANRADDAAIDADFRRSAGEAPERGRRWHPRQHDLGSGAAGLGRAFRDPAGGSRPRRGPRLTSGPSFAVRRV